MHTRLLEYLCDLSDGSDLQLSAETVIINGRVERGDLERSATLLPSAEANDSVVFLRQ